MRDLATTVPLTLAVACAVWAGLAGTYRGLRLTELVRFGGGRSDDAPAAVDADTVRLPAAPVPTRAALTREMANR